MTIYYNTTKIISYINWRLFFNSLSFETIYFCKAYHFYSHFFCCSHNVEHSVAKCTCKLLLICSVCKHKHIVVIWYVCFYKNNNKTKNYRRQLQWTMTTKRRIKKNNNKNDDNVSTARMHAYAWRQTILQDSLLAHFLFVWVVKSARVINVNVKGNNKTKHITDDL